MRIQPSALEALAAEKERVLERSFPLLESALQSQGGAPEQPTLGDDSQNGSPAALEEAPGSLDALLGGDSDSETLGGEQPPSDQ